MRCTRFATAALLAAGLGAGLCGCTTSSPGQGSSTPPAPDLAIAVVPPLTPALSLATSEQALEAGQVGKAFNFGAQRDLWVRTTVASMPAPPATAVIDLTFKNPLGEVMYESTLAFSTDPSVKQMPMQGMPAPLPVTRAKAIAGGYALDSGFPLAGTNFTRYPQTGTGDWSVLATGAGLGSGLATTMTVSFKK